MRPPRLIVLVFCIIFFPIFLTFFSALSSSPHVATPSSLAGQATGFHALFSFDIPSSLFPPSAIISLTDDNSTFFLARPAAFGPLLSDRGLSGPLWVGSGFGERTTAGAEGELGCSDIPGWGESGRQEKPAVTSGNTVGNSASGAGSDRAASKQDSDSQKDPSDRASTPSTDDGTDDHLHHPLHESDVMDSSTSDTRGDSRPTKPAAHADIQSLQESAEINGKVVLLSRGGCGFLEKVKWAQRRGGIAVIVGDDTRGGSLVTMYARGDTSNVTIPAVFTSYTTAHLLSSLIPPQAGDDSSSGDGSSASRTRLSTSHSSPGKQRVESTTTPLPTPSPTSSHYSAVDESLQNPSKPTGGIFHALLSFLGFGRNGGRSWHLPEDSRRPPSSGNIDWVLSSWDKQQAEDAAHSSSRTKSNTITEDPKKTEHKSDNGNDDGFVIGVQDWRDPDLLAPVSSAVPLPTSVADSNNAKSQNSDKSSRLASAALKGGSITPGSGEYRSVEQSNGNKKKSNVQSSSQSLPDSSGNKSGKNWFSRHFLWTRDNELESSPVVKRVRGGSQTRQTVKSEEHEGLWVTLTPTSMSTSPFFDTLLVLVISPLLTLTVVYTLLLIRSRIRRRRWRAPKSIVDRLPVRTYHTISTSSSASSSPRSPSPGPASPTSPLLGPKSHDLKSSSKVESVKGEKSGSSSSLWRRKYTGRQVECVVCLEEYINGQSRVMRLPCGHEFHVECITPWLTTRRRTCPICKGDVVRSMYQNMASEMHEPSEQPVDNGFARSLGSRHSASSAPVPIMSVIEDETLDLERHPAGSEIELLEGNASSAPQSSWRNFATLSLSALSGDTIWHQSRTENDR